MGLWALLLALLALISAVLRDGIYVGLGLGIFATVVGVLGYRSREDGPWKRLAAAGAITVAVIALLIATGRYLLTWWAVDRIIDLWS